MKLAILIVGEYRTFAHCRKTQLFLDQPDTDIYFSTWNVTNTKNPQRANSPGWRDYRPNLREVTVDEIQSALNVPATIALQEVPMPPNPPMIVGWLAGMNLVKQSGKEYDYMLVLRPDLFFNAGAIINQSNLSVYQNSVGFRPRPVSDPTCLDDTCFFSTYENIQKVLTPKLFEFNWLGHQQWYTHVTQNAGLQISNLPLPEGIIGRFPMDETSSWDIVMRQWNTWLKDGK